jgi:S-DNA-T family DNA segregation ATPase FtsK/SpoIIIE
MASSSDPAPLLPGSLQARLEAWLLGLLGYALLVLCLAAAASLLTWSAADPSFIRATNGATRNALGAAGANFSDAAMRLFGLAGVVIVLPPLFWALQLITRRELEEARMKLMLAPVAVLLLATAVSALPVLATWPLPHGLGGLLGDQVLKSFSGLLVAVGPQYASLAAAACCGLAGLILLTGSLGMSLQDLKVICQVRRPRLRVAARLWGGPAGTQARADDRGQQRREPTLDMPPGFGARRELSAEPAFDLGSPAGVPGAPAISRSRPGLRRPVQDVDFDQTTDTGSRDMARRFAPSRDEEPAGPAGLGLLRRRGGMPPAAGARPAERGPVWPGSVPKPTSEDTPSAEHDPLPRPASDELYGRAVAVVRADRKASAEYLQQRLGIGYMRAADLIDRMEQEGILGPPVHGMRAILGGLAGTRTV